MEAKTIKTVADGLGIKPEAVKRTLTRWVSHPEKSRLFTNAQRSFIQSIKAETVWPDWLDNIWCENYQPRAKDADARVVKIEPSRVDAQIDMRLLDKTAGVFDDNLVDALKKERDQLATKLKLSDKTLAEYEAEIEALRDQAEEWKKMSNTDRAKYIETRKDLEGLEREIADANSEIAELKNERDQDRKALLEKAAKVTEYAGVIQSQHETINSLDVIITNLTHERDQEAEAAGEAFAAWQEAAAKIEAYEADTWRKRISDAVKYAFSDYLIPKVVLLAFQSYIYAMYVMRVFAFLNTQVGKRADIAETYADTVLHEPWFYGMWVLGFFVDGAGFAIAQKLSEPKYLSDGDTRLTWIGWFFVLQVVIDMCYLFGTFHPIIEWFGAVVIVVAPALGIMAYARATFKKGQA